jgi:hypothetical protein
LNTPEHINDYAGKLHEILGVNAMSATAFLFLRSIENDPKVGPNLVAALTAEALWGIPAVRMELLRAWPKTLTADDESAMFPRSPRGWRGCSAPTRGPC